MITKIQDIENILYINLEKRTDRKEHIEAELKILNWKAQRFNAFTDPIYAARGCAKSHVGCMELAKNNKWNHVIVLEDDVKFTNPKLFLTQLNKFLSRHKNWDVLIIGGNNVGEYEIIDETCVKITKCLTTTAYLVNGHYIEKLLDNFVESINQLVAVDKFWNSLQEQDNWFMLTPLTVTQMSDYSDIENKHIDYSDTMLRLTN